VEPRRLPSEAEDLVQRYAASQPPEEAARLLANLASRVLAVLHQLARTEANRRKGQPDWGQWARLVNASRSAVLAASSCRDAALALSVRPAGAEVSPPADSPAEPS
jgi:hypothetical protein